MNSYARPILAIATATLVSLFGASLVAFASSTINTSIYTDGGIGIGVSSTTAGVLQTSSNAEIGGTFSVVGAASFANVQTSGGLGVGIATTTTGGIETTGAVYIGGSLTVVGNATTSTLRTNSSTIGALTAGTVAVGGATTLSKVYVGTCSVDFPATTIASSTVVTTCAATGTLTGDKVFITPSSSSSTPQYIFVSASTTAADTIQVAAWYTGGPDVNNAGAQTWTWMAIR